jgi:hypothetical protein
MLHDNDIEIDLFDKQILRNQSQDSQYIPTLNAIESRN